jgi:uncharacterized protein YndB with AHSA1/START domain
MNQAQPTNQPCAKAAMLIRKPVHEVFAAFIDPEITTKFWFTKSSGKLEPGKQVRWEWEMYNVSTQVTVQSIEANNHIRIEWEGYDAPTNVEWSFIPYGDDKTFVTITECGFKAHGEQLIEQVAGSTEGWTLVLAGLKALLEHHVKLGLTADRHPEGIEIP